MPREKPKYQESKPQADIGYLIPDGFDEIITTIAGTLVRYGSELYDLEGISENLTYEDFKERSKKK